MLSRLPPPPSASDVEKLRKDNRTFATSISLEGQAATPSEADRAREAFSTRTVASGRLVQEVWPQAPKDIKLIDPYLNVNKAWPPVAIVHGINDTTIPMFLSKQLEAKLKENEIETVFIEVEGEGHTFAGRMVRGSKTWETQRKGFDFLERMLKRSYKNESTGT